MRILIVAIVVVTSLSCLGSANSQTYTTPPAGCTVSEASEVKLVPQKLRLSMTLSAESRKGEDSLASLAEHEKKVQKALVEQGAVVDSIQFSIPTVNSGTPGIPNPASARQMLRQQAAQMRNINPQLRMQNAIPPVGDIDATLPIVFTASRSVRAEWLLPSGASKDAVLLPSKIRKIVEEQDLLGKTLKEELDQEETAIVQPLLGVPSSYAYPVNPGLPEVQFFFVSKLEKAAHDTAFENAFKKAKEKASGIAKASSKKLGDILSISGTVTSVGNPYTSSVGIPYAYSPVANMGNMVLGNDSDEFAVVDPNQLVLQVRVAVTFRME